MTIVQKAMIMKELIEVRKKEPTVNSSYWDDTIVILDKIISGMCVYQKEMKEINRRLLQNKLIKS